MDGLDWRGWWRVKWIGLVGMGIVVGGGFGCFIGGSGFGSGIGCGNLVSFLVDPGVVAAASVRCRGYIAVEHHGPFEAHSDPNVVRFGGDAIAAAPM